MGLISGISVPKIAPHNSWTLERKPLEPTFFTSSANLDFHCQYVSILPINTPSCLQVPDYLEFISQPMDFSTMLSKLEGHVYRSVADLETDFNLMVSNCLLYNSKDTVFHRAALRLRDLGGAILRHAQRQATNTGLDLDTGMHLPESPQKRDFYSCTWEDGKSQWCSVVNLNSYIFCTVEVCIPFMI